MKSLNLLLLVMIGGVLLSCSPATVSYYQVYKTDAPGLQKNEHTLVFQSDTCEISYDLWGEGGNIGFEFKNKTDQDIYLHLDQCYFIRNGYANNYFKSRTYTYSATSGNVISQGAAAARTAAISGSVTGYNSSWLLQNNSAFYSATNSVYSANSAMASKGYSIAINEEKIICIPAQSAKVFSEYQITESIFRDCELLRYPSKDQSAVKSFTRSTTPLVFSNRIVYSVGLSQNLSKVENEFYISEISNLPMEKMFISKRVEQCGEKSMRKKKFFKTIAPDLFYLEYEKPSEVIWNY